MGVFEQPLNSRTILRLGAVLALALSGCTPSVGTSQTVPPEVLPPVPIEVDGGGLGTPNDGSGIPTTSYDFIFAEDLQLPTDALGYVYFAGGSVAPERVDTLAKAFGVDADQVSDWDLRAAATDGENGEESGDPAEDGTAAPADDDDAAVSLGYSASDPLQTWTLTRDRELDDLATCTTVQPSTTATTDDSGAAVGGAPSGVCVGQERADDAAPDNEQAIAGAEELLSALGVAATTHDLSTFVDGYLATVTATERAPDGVPTGRQWVFTFGPGETVLFGSGPLATGERTGPYPLVGLDVVRDRLATWQESSLPGLLVPDGANSGFDTQSDGPLQVHIVGVAADTTALFDTANNLWQVPAYRFTDSSGGVWVVPAIDDELLQAPDAQGAESQSTGSAEPDPGQVGSNTTSGG